MLTVLNQVLRTLLHSRLQLGIQQYQDDPNCQGDIILLEPGETDHMFFKMAPQRVGGPQRWRPRLSLGHAGARAHYELIGQILQSYGVPTTRKDVRVRFERLLHTVPSGGREDVLLGDSPERQGRVA